MPSHSLSEAPCAYSGPFGFSGRRCLGCSRTRTRRAQSSSQYSASLYLAIHAKVDGDTSLRFAFHPNAFPHRSFGTKCYATIDKRRPSDAHLRQLSKFLLLLRLSHFDMARKQDRHRMVGSTAPAEASMHAIPRHCGCFASLLPVRHRLLPKSARQLTFSFVSHLVIFLATAGRLGIDMPADRFPCASKLRHGATGASNPASGGRRAWLR